MTLHELKLIFYSGQFMPSAADYDSLKEILYLIENNIIEYTIDGIYSKAEYQTTIDDISKNEIAQIDYDGGEISHQALKVLAERFLASKDIMCKIELPYAGRIPDVISKDKRIIIECGNTDPKKIFDYFEENYHIELNIISYPFDTDTAINIHTFTIRDMQQYSKCMQNKKEVDYNPLKSLIQNRRNNME